MAKEAENGGREKMAVPRFFLVPPLSSAALRSTRARSLCSPPHTHAHSLFDKPFRACGGNSEPRLLQVVDTSDTLVVLLSAMADTHEVEIVEADAAQHEAHGVLEAEHEAAAVVADALTADDDAREAAEEAEAAQKAAEEAEAAQKAAEEAEAAQKAAEEAEAAQKAAEEAEAARKAAEEAEAAQKAAEEAEAAQKAAEEAEAAQKAAEEAEAARKAAEEAEAAPKAAEEAEAARKAAEEAEAAQKAAEEAEAARKAAAAEAEAEAAPKAAAAEAEAEAAPKAAAAEAEAEAAPKAAVAAEAEAEAAPKPAAAVAVEAEAAPKAAVAAEAEAAPKPAETTSSSVSIEEAAADTEDEPVVPAESEEQRRVRLATEAKDRGNAAYRRKAYEEAIRHYSEAIEYDPANHLVWSNRALMYITLKQYDRAEADAKRTVELCPTFWKGILRWAQAVELQSRFPEALAILEQATGATGPEAKQIKDQAEALRSKIQYLHERESYVVERTMKPYTTSKFNLLVPDEYVDRVRSLLPCHASDSSYVQLGGSTRAQHSFWRLPPLWPSLACRSRQADARESAASYHVRYHLQEGRLVVSERTCVGGASIVGLTRGTAHSGGHFGTLDDEHQNTQRAGNLGSLGDPANSRHRLHGACGTMSPERASLSLCVLLTFAMVAALVHNHVAEHWPSRSDRDWRRYHGTWSHIPDAYHQGGHQAEL